MAKRAGKRLTTRTAETLKEPGRHADGNGLYLVVDPSGAKRWAFLFRWKQPGATGAGKVREYGIGPFLSVGLSEAREKADAARALIQKGVDPIAARRAEAVPTFGAFADSVIESRAPGLRSDKSLARWKRALQLAGEGSRIPADPAKAKAEAHRRAALATMRGLPVNQVGVEHVLALLSPVWAVTPEMAHKARGYVEAVLDAAKAKGLRTGDNPAAWRGHLDHLLPKRSKLSRGHHAAMPFAEIPAFVSELRAREATAARALEFCILNASRSGEVLGATWAEIDREARVWTIPGARMKAGVEHRVPLTERALAILEAVRPLAGEGDYVFPGAKAGRPLSGMAFDMLLRRLKREDVTTHGFRSSFRDWAGEATNFPRELAEAALAHAVGNQTEQAYRRGDALEKRRKVMDAWARFCEPRQGSTVVNLNARRVA